MNRKATEAHLGHSHVHVDVFPDALGASVPRLCNNASVIMRAKAELPAERSVKNIMQAVWVHMYGVLFVKRKYTIGCTKKHRILFSKLQYTRLGIIILEYYSIIILLFYSNK